MSTYDPMAFLSQATGVKKVGSITILNVADMEAAAKKMNSDTDPTDWMSFENKNNNEIAFTGMGSGGIEELAKSLDDKKIQYGVVQLTVDGDVASDESKSFQVKKSVFLSWVGPGIADAMTKSKAAMYKGDLLFEIRRNMTVSSEYMAELWSEVNLQSIKQSLMRTRTDASGEESNKTSSGPVSIHLNDGLTTPEWGDGIYITMEYSSEGSFFTHHSKTPVPGAIAFIKPGVKQAGFKYTQNGGKKEFARQIGGVFKKNNCVAWTGIFKLARDNKGEIIIMNDRVGDKNIYVINDSPTGNVSEFKFDEFFKFDNVLGIAVTPKICTLYNVITMEKGMFANVANNKPDSAALLF